MGLFGGGGGGGGVRVNREGELVYSSKKPAMEILFELQ